MRVRRWKEAMTPAGRPALAGLARARLKLRPAGTNARQEHRPLGAK